MGKFCKECGSELPSEKASVCVKCGVSTLGTSVPEFGKPWGQGTVVLLFLITLGLPIVGVIAGIIGMLRVENRNYGAFLFCSGILFWIMWAVIFMGALSI